MCECTAKVETEASRWQNSVNFWRGETERLRAQVELLEQALTDERRRIAAMKDPLNLREP